MRPKAGKKTECLRAPLVASFHLVVYVCVLVQEVATIKAHKHNLLCFYLFSITFIQKFSLQLVSKGREENRVLEGPLGSLLSDRCERLCTCARSGNYKGTKA